jgi:hypothetical protein
MKPRFMWPGAAVVALGIVVLGIATVEAQRGGFDRPAPAPVPHAGRFVVAHALAERIVILDTATGQLYVAGEKDMKKFSELPKVATITEERIRAFREQMKEEEAKRGEKRDREGRKEEKKDQDDQ